MPAMSGHPHRKHSLLHQHFGSSVFLIPKQTTEQKSKNGLRESENVSSQVVGVLYLENGVFLLLLGAMPGGMFPGNLEAFGVPV